MLDVARMSITDAGLMSSAISAENPHQSMISLRCPSMLNEP